MRSVESRIAGSQERRPAGPRGSRPGGPSPARWAVRAFLGSRAAPDALASLDELYRLKKREEGAARAWWWYWRQIPSFLLHARALRKLGRFGTGAPGQGPSRNPRPGASQVIRLDLRFAVKALARAPVFSLVSILTLGLGMGVTLAMAGILETALLRPLPFPQAERLVIGRATVGERLNPWVSAPDFLDYREGAGGFEGMAAILPFSSDATITGGDEAMRAVGTTVSVGLFSTLGVLPELGRAFTPEESSRGGPNVLVLSHGYWQSRLGGSPDVVGRTLTVNDVPFTVVGVMPAGFHFLLDVDFWLPMRPDRDAASMRDRHNWFVLGRLGRGVSLDQAQASVDLVSARLQEAYPETNQNKALLLTDLRAVLVEDHGGRLAILTVAAVLILLIACANVTGMMLARAPSRAHELSIRAALGAGRVRLARGMLLESFVLASAGGFLGVGLALLFQRLVLDYLQMDRLGLREAGLSLPLLLAALSISLASGVAAGLYPSFRSLGRNLAQDLKEGARNLGGGGTVFRSGLVMAQITLSVVLLVASGLLIRSFAAKQAVDPGFDSTNTLTTEIQLSPTRYPPGASRAQFFSELDASLEVLPGVTSASAISHLPIRHPRNRFAVQDPRNRDNRDVVFLRSVLPGYFETMSIPLVAGRFFSPSDGPEGLQVAILNQAMAESFFPGENPVGRQVELDYFGTPQTLEVVGMVGDVRISGLEFDPGAALYRPHAQFPVRTMHVVVRSSVNPGAVADGVRATLRRADENLPLSGFSTLEEVVGESVAEEGLIATCMTVYALLPLLLAAVGLYAVIASYVSFRLHEIGIRMALGADASRIGAMVVGRGIWLVGVGALAGLGAAYGLTRFLQQFLFGVEPTDPLTFSGVIALVVGIALTACVVPTLKAIRSDPKAILNSG